MMLEVLKHGSISRTQIASEIGLTGAAVTRITRELLERGLLMESDKTASGGTVGRRRTTLKLSAGGPYVIGFAIQASERLMVLANLRGEILSQVHIPLKTVTEISEDSAHLRELADELLETAGITIEKVAGIGVAVAGAVDPSRNFISSSPPLAWTNVNLGDLLDEQFNVPVSVENLNNAIITSEHTFGVGQGYRNIMIFRFSYSVGGGFIFEEKIVRGNEYGAGQIGHAPVPGSDRLCYCGNKGCLNAIASGISILAQHRGQPYHEVALDNVIQNTQDMLDLLDQSEAGDQSVQELLKETGRQFGNSLNSFAVVFRPEQVLLAGQVGRNPYFVEGVRESLSQDTRPDSLSNDRVEVSKMSVAQASVYLALLRFVFSESLDMESLKIIEPVGSSPSSHQENSVGLVMSEIQNDTAARSGARPWSPMSKRLKRISYVCSFIFLINLLVGKGSLIMGWKPVPRQNPIRLRKPLVFICLGENRCSSTRTAIVPLHVGNLTANIGGLSFGEGQFPRANFAPPFSNSLKIIGYAKTFMKML